MPRANFFKETGPLNFSVGEQTISAWKTTQHTINVRKYITIDEGSDGNASLVGQTFEVIAYHFSGQKIAFNRNFPLELSSLRDAPPL